MSSTRQNKKPKSVAITIALMLLFSAVTPIVYAGDTAQETPQESPEVQDSESTVPTDQVPTEESEGESPDGSTEETEVILPDESGDEMLKTTGSETEEDIYHRFRAGEIPKSPIEKRDSFQTSLYTGSAAYIYPIEVPPGTNGLTPEVTLSYNSQSARGMAGWVGLGWDLNRNYILRDVNYTPDDLNDDEFDMIMNGQKYDLVYVPSEGRYHTKVESYLYIENKSGGSNQKGEYWIVRTKDGTEYRFGYYGNNKPPEMPASSEVLCSNRDYVWRWYLDQITDTHDNKIYLRYNQSPNPSDIGAIYPYKIIYNNDEKREIEFVLENTDKSDMITIYDQGCKICESRRLKEIRVKANGSLVRRYILNYTFNGRSLLSSITQYAPDGSNLPPTIFEYQSLEKGWHETSDWTMPENLTSLQSRFGIRFVDVNGDGLPDILEGYKYKKPYEEWKYRYNAWINNGTGWDQVDEWKPPIYFSFNRKISATYCKDNGVELADLNADGLVDIFTMNVSGARIWFNTGHGWLEDNSWGKPEGLDGLRGYGVRVADVNGDGLIDILRGYRYTKIDSGTTTSYQQVWINNGQGWDQADDIWQLPVYFTYKVRYWDNCDTKVWDSGAAIADVNGDGLPDILERSEGVWVNTGQGWEFDSDWGEIPTRHLTNDEIKSGIRIADVNGDGLPDILQGHKGGSSPDWEYTYNAWINNGHGWDQVDEWKPKTYFGGGEKDWLYDYAKLSDINGDGLVDTIALQTFINKGPTPDLIKKIHNSIGGTYIIDYNYSTKFDNTGSDDILDIDFPIWVVSSVTEDNGMSGAHHTSSTYTYDYKDGCYDYEDKEFRGFGYVKVTDPNCDYKEYKFHQDDARKGKVNKTEIKDSSGNPYTKTENLWSFTESDGTYKPLLNRVDEYTYDGDGSAAKKKTTRIEYLNYDQFGNANDIKYHGDISVQGDEKIIHNTYTTNESNWIVDRLMYSQLRADDGSTIMSLSLYYYDNQELRDSPQKGDLTKKGDWFSDGLDPETNYEYFSHGNLKKITDANGHSTHYQYDDTYTFPTKITNAMDQEYNYLYDLGTGNLLSYTDPNGFVTNYSYDTFGRVESESRPYDIIY